MKFVYDHDLHIHSNLSLCCHDSGLDAARVLLYAKNRGLKEVVLTDHFWDESVPGASDWYAQQDYAHVCKSLPLPQAEGIRFMFGCEIDMNRFGTVGLAKEHFDRFDFVLIPTTHLHMVGYTLTEEDAKSIERRAELWVERLDHLLSLDLPFEKIGIPHLTCPLCTHKFPREELYRFFDLIPEAEMVRLFQKAAKLGVGIEINSADFQLKSPREEESVARIYRTAKAQGCKFFLGGDCHAAMNFAGKKKSFEYAIDLIGLEESDKYRVPQK